MLLLLTGQVVVEDYDRGVSESRKEVGGNVGMGALLIST